MDKDFALSWTFVDDDGRPMQLRFRLTDADPDDQASTGQLIAVIADPTRADHHDERAISRPNVLEHDVETALDGWEHWAMLHPGRDDRRWINLTTIRRRIHDAGLD